MEYKGEIEMKVVWLGQEKHLSPALNHLRFALARIVDLVAYGDGQDFIPEFDVLKIVEKEKPEAIFIGSNQYKFVNLDKVAIPKALKLSDPHANFERHCNWLKENKVHALPLFGHWVSRYAERLGEATFLPWCIEHRIYRDYGLQRTIDISYTTSPCKILHPIRSAMTETLPKIDDIKSFTSNKKLSREDYIRTIAQSKIFAFDCSKHRYGMPKFYEGMSCGCAVLADRPADWELLHFVPNKTFIEITKEDWLETLRYYLANPYERIKIAEEGHRIFMKYHNADVRAMELVKILEGLM